MEDDIARTREGRETRTRVTLREGPHMGHACLSGSYLSPPLRLACEVSLLSLDNSPDISPHPALKFYRYRIISVVKVSPWMKVSFFGIT